MPTYSDTEVDLVINKPSQSQFDSATGLDPTELFFVEPEFQGSKLLQTSATGDIVESDDTPTTIQVLSATDSITLTDGYCYQGGEQTSLTIALPASATVGFVSQITFKSGSSATAFSAPQTGIVWNIRGEDIDSANNAFVPVANKVYTVLIGYDGYSFTALTGGYADAS